MVLELQLVERERDVRTAMFGMTDAWRARAIEYEDCQPGFQGGRRQDSAYWRPELGVWSVHMLMDNRHWVVFGTEKPQARSGLTITAEINPPVRGVNRRCQGALATDSRDRVWLCHRGHVNVTNGRGDAPKLLDAYAGHVPASLVASDGRSDPAIAITRIGSRSMLRDIAAFVHVVALYKRMAAA